MISVYLLLDFYFVKSGSMRSYLLAAASSATFGRE